MHTLIRDQEISKHDFVFYSDRLIRLVIMNSLHPENYCIIIVPESRVLIMIFQVAEHGLGHLPFTEKQIITPTGKLDQIRCILRVLFYLLGWGMPLSLSLCSSMSWMWPFPIVLLKLNLMQVRYTLVLTFARNCVGFPLFGGKKIIQISCSEYIRVLK